jgi:hypothetical protein
MPDADRMCAAVTSASRTTLLSFCRGREPALDLLGGRVRLMPRRYSAEPAGASAGGDRAVPPAAVPSIGTYRLVQKISGFLCGTKDRRRRLENAHLTSGVMKLFGRTISHDLRGET